MTVLRVDCDNASFSEAGRELGSDVRGADSIHGQVLDVAEAAAMSKRPGVTDQDAVPDGAKELVDEGFVGVVG